MHHTFYGRPVTTCGMPIAETTSGVTGLDSRVTCPGCIIELEHYRRFFPQASNRIERVQVGDRLVERAVNEGGAR